MPPHALPRMSAAVFAPVYEERGELDAMCGSNSWPVCDVRSRAVGGRGLHDPHIGNCHGGPVGTAAPDADAGAAHASTPATTMGSGRRLAPRTLFCAGRELGRASRGSARSAVGG